MEGELAAFADSMDMDGYVRSAPLLPQTRQGAVLAGCLEATPELFEAAVEHQLEVLAGERELDRQNVVSLNGPGAGSGAQQSWAKEEGLLRRRIQEVRGTERSLALEDVLYMIILSKHHDFNVRPSTGCEPDDLAWLHSPASKVHLQALIDMQPAESIQLIVEHVQMATVGLPEFIEDEATLLPTLGVAQVYRRGILFGYSLEQVMERFKLETSLRALMDRPIKAEEAQESRSLEDYTAEMLVAQQSRDQGERVLSPEYAEYTDEYDYAPEVPVLEDGARFGTEEAMRVAERHATTVFGSMDTLAGGLRDVIAGATDADDAQVRVEAAMASGEVETLPLTLAAVCHLVMEGVAFGRCLRQAERAVDLSYGLEPLVL